jgi:hypothetical protein
MAQECFRRWRRLATPHASQQSNRVLSPRFSGSRGPLSSLNIAGKRSTLVLVESFFDGVRWSTGNGRAWAGQDSIAQTAAPGCEGGVFKPDKFSSHRKNRDCSSVSSMAKPSPGMKQ